MLVVLLYLLLRSHSFFLEFKQALEVIHFSGEGFVFLNPFFVDAYFTLYAFCPFGVVPKCRV
jgi:hypothetical protein